MQGELLEILALERLGEQAPFAMYRWQKVRREGEFVGYELYGAVQASFGKWVPTTERMAFFTLEEAERLAQEWEQRTGRCPHCVGYGNVPVKFQREDTLYGLCQTCEGTGCSAQYPEAFYGKLEREKTP